LKFYYIIINPQIGKIKQNDVIIDNLEVLLHHNQFVRPQIGQITQLRITKMQKNSKISNICTKIAPFRAKMRQN